MEAAIVEKYKGIVVSIPDVMVTTKDGFAWAYGYSWEWLRQGMPVHARTGESLPTGTMWEDLWISVTDEREIVFSYSRGGEGIHEGFLSGGKTFFQQATGGGGPGFHEAGL